MSCASALNQAAPGVHRPRPAPDVRVRARQLVLALIAGLGFRSRGGLVGICHRRPFRLARLVVGAAQPGGAHDGLVFHCLAPLLLRLLVQFLLGDEALPELGVGLVRLKGRDVEGAQQLVAARAALLAGLALDHLGPRQDGVQVLLQQRLPAPRRRVLVLLEQVLGAEAKDGRHFVFIKQIL